MSESDRQWKSVNIIFIVVCIYFNVWGWKESVWKERESEWIRMHHPNPNILSPTTTNQVSPALFYFYSFSIPYISICIYIWHTHLYTYMIHTIHKSLYISLPIQFFRFLAQPIPHTYNSSSVSNPQKQAKSTLFNTWKKVSEWIHVWEFEIALLRTSSLQHLSLSFFNEEQPNQPNGFLFFHLYLYHYTFPSPFFIH